MDFGHISLMLLGILMSTIVIIGLLFIVGSFISVIVESFKNLLYNYRKKKRSGPFDVETRLGYLQDQVRYLQDAENSRLKKEHKTSQSVSIPCPRTSSRKRSKAPTKSAKSKKS